MTDNIDDARKAAASEHREMMRLMREVCKDVRFDAAYYNGRNFADLPDGNGEAMFIPITIGMRGYLSKAKRGASMWREATSRYPKGIFMISLLGYNDDPR